jgi:hypothetical protein
MKEYVRLTIEELKVSLGFMEKLEAEIKQSIRVLLELEGVPMVTLPPSIISPGALPPSDGGTVSVPAGQTIPPLAHVTPKPEPKARSKSKPGPKPRSEPGHEPKANAGKSRRGRKNPFSQYEGVYNGGHYADGRPKYLAGLWANGKNKHLGSFAIEEEAAAAVQRAKGNKIEAKRLSELAQQKAADMIEQQENNPDRPAGGRRKAEGSPLVWECDRCGRQLPGAERPKVCDVCLKDNGFHQTQKRPVKPDNTPVD